MRYMKDSGIEWIGEIPVDWNIRKYKNYCNVFAGGTPDTRYSEYYGGNIPWIQSGKIQFCDIIDCSRYITEEGLNNSATKLIKKNTALLAMTGATCGNVGFLKFPCCANQSVMAFETNELVHDRFIYYSLMIQEHYIKIKQNGSAQSGINVESGKNMLFAYCNIEEQELIADYLGSKVKEIDNIISKTKETIEEYKKYKQSVITEAVTKGLNPNVEMKDSGIEWIIKIPKNWEKLKLKYISQLSPQCDTSHLNENSIITFTPMEYIKNGYFIHNTAKWNINNSSYSIYGNGDIAIAKVTPCFENGNISIMENLNNSIGLGSSELYILRCNNKVIPKYLLYYLQNNIFKNIGVSTMTGAGGLKRVSSDLLKNHEIPLPSLEEQKEIVEFLNVKCTEIGKLISKKQNLITELEQYKKSLIYECVTGKKEVSPAYAY